MRLVQGLLLQLGGPREGLVPLSCRRRPPSRPPTSASRSLARQRTCAPTHHPDSRLGLQTQDDGSRPPCVAGLVRDLGSHQGPALRADRATRLSALRTLSVSSRSLVRSSVAITPDQTRPEQSSAVRIRKSAGPSLEFRIDSQPISRISQAAPDHNLFPSCNVHFTICNTLVYQPGAQTDIIICTCSTCPRHLYLLSYSIRNQNQAKAVSQLSQLFQSVSLHIYRPDGSPEPHSCSRWFGMSDENRLVLDLVAQVPKEPGVKRHHPSHSSPTQSQQDRNLAVQQFRRPPA